MSIQFSCMENHIRNPLLFAKNMTSFQQVNQADLQLGALLGVSHMLFTNS